MPPLDMDALAAREKAERYEKLCKHLDRMPWDECAQIERDSIYPRIDDEPKKVSKMNYETKPDSDPVDKHSYALDLLNAKAEKLRQSNPCLSFAQAFEKVYTDRTNSDLANAERRNNGIYNAERELEDLQTLVKHDKALRKAGRARLAPDNLGEYETGSSMTPGLRGGYPSVDEVLALVEEQRRKGFTREKAFDLVATKMLRGA